MDNESILEIISKNIKSTEVDDKLKICDFRKLLYKELHRDFSYKYAELIRKLFAIEVKEREALCSYDCSKVPCFLYLLISFIINFAILPLFLRRNAIVSSTPAPTKN